MLLKGQSRRSSHLLSSTNRFWFIRYSEIISVQAGAQNKIRVEFKFNEELKSLTTDYLKRSEALDFRMNNMKETLFNQIKQSEFDLIVSLGKGELKSQDTFII